MSKCAHRSHVLFLGYSAANSFTANLIDSIISTISIIITTTIKHSRIRIYVKCVHSAPVTVPSFAAKIFPPTLFNAYVTLCLRPSDDDHFSCVDIHTVVQHLFVTPSSEVVGNDRSTPSDSVNTDGLFAMKQTCSSNACSTRGCIDCAYDNTTTPSTKRSPCSVRSA